MISKPEIIRIAGQLNLNPHVVEKSYALGWLLAGIFANGKIADSWVFKGGTCLKKCFFETYRFSEDLDFTLKDESHLDKAFLKEVFAEIGEWVYEQSGLEIPADRQDFDIYNNPRNQKNCQGKISYRGPVSPTTGGWPRIELDLTADECLVLTPVPCSPISKLSALPPRTGFASISNIREACCASNPIRCGVRRKTTSSSMHGISLAMPLGAIALIVSRARGRLTRCSRRAMRSS